MVFILLMAFVLRVYQNHAWLPEALFDPDEKIYVASGMEMLEGMPPKKIEMPGALYIFLLSFSYLLHFLLTNFLEIFHSLLRHDMIGLISMMNDYFIAFYRNGSAQYILARTLSGIFGTLSIGAIYHLGRNLFNSKTGWLSAGLLSILPLHLSFSHLASAFVMAGFFYLLALDSIVNTAREGKLRDYLLSGLLIGFSLAIRLNTFPLLIAFFTAHFLHIRNSKGNIEKFFFHRSFLAGLLTVVLAFYVACPYIITTGLLFLKEFGFRVFFPGVPVVFLSEVGKVLLVLKRELGLVAFVLVLIAFVIGLFRRRAGEVILITALVTDLLILAKAGFLYERYIFLMIFPSILLVAALLADEKLNRSPSLRFISIALASALFLPLSFGSLKYTSSLKGQHTIVQAKQWLEAHVANYGTVLMPNGLIPLPESRESLQKKLTTLSQQDVLQIKFSIQIQPDKPLSSLFGASRHSLYDYVIFSEMIMHEEKYWMRELSFKLADKTYEEKVFNVEWFASTEYFLIMRREDALKKYESGRVDYFVDIESHKELGNPVVQFKSDDHTVGPAIFIYSTGFH